MTDHQLDRELDHQDHQYENNVEPLEGGVLVVADNELLKLRYIKNGWAHLEDSFGALIATGIERVIASPHKSRILAEALGIDWDSLHTDEAIEKRRKYDGKD